MKNKNIYYLFIYFSFSISNVEEPWSVYSASFLNKNVQEGVLKQESNEQNKIIICSNNFKQFFSLRHFV